jgi:D-proline reductase (dithiol) PrdB
VSLAARHLEANGLPTVIVGSAMDIVSYCGVARFLFTDFPLGNPSGHPWRRDMQREIVAQALRLLERAEAPRTIVTAPFTWTDDPGWRARYARVDPKEIAKLRAAGEERRRLQAQARELKTTSKSG